MLTFKDLKIIYFEGRPSAHPFHRAAALSLQPKKILFIDFCFRWQDKNNPIFRRSLSWLFSSLFLSNKKKYDIFLIDGLHMFPVLMKKFGLINRNQKIIAHMGSHTLYLSSNNYFNAISNWLNIYMLKSYDYFVCEGNLQYDLVTQLAPNSKAILYKSFLGVRDDRLLQLIKHAPKLNTKKIFFVGDFNSHFRIHYKGIDLLVEVFNILSVQDSEIEFHLFGHFDDKIDLLVNKTTVSRFILHGHSDTAFNLPEKYSLYLHLSRGDAFPTATLEAMLSGVPVMLSSITGTAEVIQVVTPNMVVNNSPLDIAQKISDYFQLSSDQRIELATLQRLKAKRYNFKEAITRYHEIFNDIAQQIKRV